MAFRSRGKGGRLFVPHVNPLKTVCHADRIRDAIQRIARNPVDPPDACFGENLYQQIRYCFLSH
jgi:hypothetical protein